MVFVSIACVRAVYLFFASTSSCQIFHASSEHLRNTDSEHFEYFVSFSLAGISLLLIGYVVLRQVMANQSHHVPNCVT